MGEAVKLGLRKTCVTLFTNKKKQKTTQHNYQQHTYPITRITNNTYLPTTQYQQHLPTTRITNNTHYQQHTLPTTHYITNNNTNITTTYLPTTHITNNTHTNNTHYQQHTLPTTHITTTHITKTQQIHITYTTHKPFR